MMTRKKLNNVLALALAVVLTVGLLPIQASAAAIAFTDVPKDRWYYADVTELASKGVVSGTGNNKFEPERTVANAEMIKMVVNAFFRSEYTTYETTNSNTMYAYFGNQLYWFSFMSYYARQTGLLDGIDVDIRDYASCYQPMTRNDMAMILANAAKAKGIAPTEAQKAAVQSDIKDYASIPAKYQDAVKTCFALKTTNASGVTKSLLEGDNGYFYGRDSNSVNMTRAEACAVIIRLGNLITNGGTMVDPDPGPSEPTVPTVKDIVVTTATNSQGTAYHVADNGFGTGKLNNGKEINEANIAELLDKAKTIWPTGMTWADTTIVTSGNNWYANPGTVTRNMLTTNGVWTDANEGCGGFSALISDYLFGKSGNPCHTVTNFKDIRPGDVVVQFKADKSVSHVMIVTSVLQTGQFAGNGVFIAQGNYGKVIDWPDETDEWESYDNDMLAEKGSYIVLSRWPESAATQPSTPTSNPNPTPSVPTEKDITVTTATNSMGTAYHIADNGNPTGYLANGKPINEANIAELLNKAKTIWPTGMTWADTSIVTSGNNWYANPGTLVRESLSKTATGATQNISPQFGCGGFAAMVSDYLFGKTANPYHRVTNFADIRPGDIIVQLQTGNIARHVMIVTGINQTGSRAGYVFVAEGNLGNVIHWPGTSGWDAAGPDDLAAYGSYVILSRWPS